MSRDLSGKLALDAPINDNHPDVPSFARASVQWFGIHFVPVFIAGCVAIILGGWHSFGTLIHRQESDVGSTSVGSTSKAQLVSIGSCAASGCHGSRISSDGEDCDAWKSSYSVWASSDPHAGAYTTLLSDRSKRIVENLYASDVDNQWSYSKRLQQSCTICHSTVQQEDPLNDLSFADGVNCQSCHGAAGGTADDRRDGWGYVHTLRTWNNAEKSDYGYQDLTQLAARIEACVKCHVGSPGQEVNHDLIAAGHPRLNFEFAAYMDRLSETKHWSDASGLPVHESWALGQLICARSAAELLQHAAKQPDANQANQVWPEFAGYRCDSCHLPIAPVSAGSSAINKSNIGKWEWGSWYFPPGNIQLDQAYHNLSAGLKDQMSFPAPDRQAVAQSCTELIRQLQDSVKKLAGSNRSAESFRMLKSAVNRDSMSSLDEIEQWYLAVRALVASKQPEDVSDNVETLLGEFRTMLEKQDAGFGTDEQIEIYNQKAKTILEKIAPWLEPGTN